MGHNWIQLVLSPTICPPSPSTIPNGRPGISCAPTSGRSTKTTFCPFMLAAIELGRMLRPYLTCRSAST
jgi:hypothetical protein